MAHGVDAQTRLESVIIHIHFYRFDIVKVIDYCGRDDEAI